MGIMVITQDVLDKIKAELDQAERARASGFEGKARVNARRAAGMAIRAFYQFRGIAVGATSAYDLLQTMRDRPETPVEIRRVIEHLLTRVDVEFNLPVPVDLIAESRWLVRKLNES